MADQPTREQFEAAAKKVAASAPAGLSREDFFALIDKELGRTNPTDFLKQQGGSVLEMSRRAASGERGPQTGNESKEPGTWMGGFVKSLKDQILTPDLKKTMQDAAMDPKTGLLAPLDATRSVSAGVLRRIPAVTKAAASTGKGGVAGAVGFPFRMIREFNETLPSTMAERVEQFRGPRTATAPTPVSVTSGGNDVVDRALRTRSVPAVKPPTQKSPTLSDTLQQALEEVGASPLEEARKTLPPEMRTAGEGTLKQSGKFPKRPAQAGGYSSGRPSITPQDYDELLHNSLTERLGMGQANPSAETIGAGPHPDMAAERAAGAEPQAIGGPPASDAPVSSSAESAATSDWPPMEVGRDWHSGAEPGSQDAQLARGLHQDIGDMDAMYRSRTGTTSPLSTIMPDKLGLDDLLAQILGSGWKPPLP